MKNESYVKRKGIIFVITIITSIMEHATISLGIRIIKAASP
jgi:hypothetical protein